MKDVTLEDLNKLDSLEKRVLKAHNRNPDNPLVKDADWLCTKLRAAFAKLQTPVKLAPCTCNPKPNAWSNQYRECTACGGLDIISEET